MNVLASLTYKEGSEKFLEKIKGHVNTVYASAGTKKYLENNGIECTFIIANKVF